MHSTPSFSEFDPREVPYQAVVMDDMNYNYDWALGMHEVLLSGSVGSAKSILAAHLGVLDCLQFPHSRGCLARKALPDLRDTIYTKICEHLEGTILADGTELREGKHYFLNDTRCYIRFFNGSEIISRTWHDRKYKKVGSLELSWAIVEELAENDDQDEQAMQFLRMRVGRLPHVPRSWIMYCTNPDSPSHFAYNYFDIGKRQLGKIENLPQTRHVYFSKTSDNKFLPPTYVEQLLRDLPPKLAERMVYGIWNEIDRDRVYYAYGEHNFRDREYEIDPLLPINICHDFNIAQGKPMSACLSQYIPEKDEFHFFSEVIIEGADTEALMQEMVERDLFEYDVPCYDIYGDQTGDSKSPASKRTNYDIILGFLSDFRTKSGSRIQFERNVPRKNPPIRERHNIVNGYCRNALGKTRLFVYQGCPTLHKGMRLTELKKGGQYLEDDSKPYQHVTTALGYHVHRIWKNKQSNTGLRMKRIR